MRVAFFGGAFNPIHIGHVNVAQRIIDEGLADKVFFVPSYNPPHRNVKELANFNYRCEMIKKVCEKNHCFKLCDIEKKIKGKTYTYEVLDRLRKENQGKDFIIVIGSDQLEIFNTWKNYEYLIENYKFIVFKRGKDPLDIKREKDFLRNIKIKVLDFFHIPVSSSYIRKRIKEKKGIRYLILDEVFNYLKEKNIYGE